MRRLPKALCRNDQEKPPPNFCSSTRVACELLLEKGGRNSSSYFGRRVLSQRLKRDLPARQTRLLFDKSSSYIHRT